jgi:hypothetical protein
MVPKSGSEDIRGASFKGVSRREGFDRRSAGVHREHAAHMAGLHCIWHGRDHE